MKLYFKSALASVLLLSAFLTGCLKDKDYDDRSAQSLRSDGTQKVVALSLTATSTDNHQQVSLNSSNSDTTFNLVPVTLTASAGGGGALEDVKVVVVLNPALIGNYNAQHGTLHEEAPASKFTIVNAPATGGGYIVTIPKGSTIGWLQIKIKPNNFLGFDYALGVQISKVETPGYLVSTNASAGVVGIGIKNKYDGEYTLTGTYSDVLAPANNPTATDPYPYNVYLITASASSNVMYIPGAGYYHWIIGGSVYGEFCPIFTFNTTTDAIVAVNNYYGDPSATRFRSGEIDPTGLNKFNADRSIDVKYIMRQSGVIKTYFNEHLTYVGPRP